MTGIIVFTILISWILWPLLSIKSKSAIYNSSAPLIDNPLAISIGLADGAKTVCNGVYVSLNPDFPLTATLSFKSKTGTFLIMIKYLIMSNY